MSVVGEDTAGRRREQLSFFRQGSWMVLANLAAGVCLAAVHAPASRMPSKDEYSLFTSLLDALGLLLIPIAGIQFVVARMVAGAVDAPARARARTALRQLLVAVTGVGALGVLVVGLTREALVASWRMPHGGALWLTVTVALTGLWYSVFAGALQGGQRFSWLGWSSIVAGAGRVAGVVLCVGVLGGMAAGAMAGVLLGAAASLVLAAWGSRTIWRGEGAAFSWGPLLGHLLALTAGLAAYNVLSFLDSVVVRITFAQDETAYYMAAGRIGRGLVAFTSPLALVLFPKIARSAATGEPTAALRLALGAILGTGLGVAMGCTLAPGLVLRILFAGNPAFAPAASLVPWFCWCMLPLTAAYALINNLLARGQFRAVPWLVLVAAAYAATLWWSRGGWAGRPTFDAFRGVLQTLGVFSLLLLLVALVFSLRGRGAGAGPRPA